MQTALTGDPNQVLDRVERLGQVYRHPNPQMVPILFERDDHMYIGWQLKGVIPLLFNCEYKSELWIPELNVSSPTTMQDARELSDPVWGKIVTIFQKQMYMSADEIYPALTLARAGVDPLDRVEFMIALKLEFNINISDSDSKCFKTLGSVYDYIKRRIEKA